ncbi:hypothetical protein NIES4074_42540 [Cylindrospermum sp. NIES-4074]|nr:hypothetical protein NIES4074_42540 [Cylindrospermum sp. NIES-4074]
MRLLQPKPTTISTFIPPTNLPLTARNTPASRLAALQARSDRNQVDDLSAVSQVLKAQYKRQQASKLQAETLPEEEEKQGKLAHQASKLQAETLPEEEEKQGKSAHQASKLQAETLPEEEEKQGKSAHQGSKLQFRQVQGKEDWQKRANPAAIFSGSGNSLSASLMAKYERLMPGVSLGHVKVFQGASVDASLAQAGLQGLTDGTQIAVSSQAQSGTLEHELGHVAQRQTPGFNLNEGSREGYEQNADQISARLVSNQPVSQFQGLAKGKRALGSGSHSHSVLAAKCTECEKEQAKPDLKLAKTISISGKGQLQAFPAFTQQYWTEYLSCYANIAAVVFGTALSLMKECGAQAAQAIGSALLSAAAWFKDRTGNFFAGLAAFVESLGMAVSALKSTILTLVICAVTVMALIVGLLTAIWCLISATIRSIEKANRKLQEAKDQQERQRLQQDIQNLQQNQQRLQQQHQDLQQTQQTLLNEVNRQRSQQGKQPCGVNGSQLVCP